MDDLKKLIASTVKGDSSLDALLGSNANDSRFYPVYNPNTQINISQKGFINYRMMTAGEPGGAVFQPTFRLSVWAIDWVTVEQIRDRLIALLHKKKMTTGNGRIIYSKVVYETDTTPEATSSTNFPGKTIDFRIGYQDVGYDYP
jgi:hypothetical protein